MKRKFSIGEDDDIASSAEGALRDMKSDVVKLLDAEINEVVIAMEDINDSQEAFHVLDNPIKNIKMRINDISTDIDCSTVVIAEIIKRSDSKKSFTVALLMEYLEIAWPTLSLRAVYEYLLEDSHGVSFDQEVMYSSMPDPSTDSKLLASDVFVSALVVRVNMLNIYEKEEPLEMTYRSQVSNWTVWGERCIDVNPDIALLASICLDRALIVGPFFDKLKDMEHVRRRGLDCMTRVTPSAFIKAISQGMRMKDNFLEYCVELRALIDGLLWPDLLKFIELCQRRFYADTKHPVAYCREEKSCDETCEESCRKHKNDRFATRLRMRFNDVEAHLRKANLKRLKNVHS